MSFIPTEQDRDKKTIERRCKSERPRTTSNTPSLEQRQETSNQSDQATAPAMMCIDRLPEPAVANPFLPTMFAIAPFPLVQAPNSSHPIGDNDILLGRGAQHAKNPGNRRFYQMIDSSIPLYDAAKTKHEKSHVVLSIFQTLVAQKSRFIKKNEDDGSFEVIEDKDARQKISHAIRYRKQNMSETSLISMALKKSAPSSSGEKKPAARRKKDDVTEAPQSGVSSSSISSTTGLSQAYAAAIYESNLSASIQVCNTTFLNDQKREAVRKEEAPNNSVALTYPCIISDEDLGHALRDMEDFPSCSASFQFFAEQDEYQKLEDQEEGGGELDDGKFNLW